MRRPLLRVTRPSRVSREQTDLRVKTDARVVSHNATSVTKNGARGQTYAWKIKSVFDPPPRLVIATR